MLTNAHDLDIHLIRIEMNTAAKLKAGTYEWNSLKYRLLD